MAQLLADPGFDDPAAWDITPGSAATVAGSVLDIDANLAVGQVSPKTGYIGAMANRGVFLYRLVVSAAVAPAGALQLWIGGVLVWTPADGSGTHVGYIQQPVPADPITGPITGVVFQYTGSGRAIIESLSVTDMHVRQAIREEIETAVTGLSTTGSNVFPSAVYNLQESQLPALQVITGEEQVLLEAGTLDAPQRSLSMTIKGTAQATSNVDNTLDTIAEEVEAALAADITLNGYAHGLDLQSTSFDFSGEGDKPLGSVSLVYSIMYRTPFGDPTTVA